MTDFYFPDVPWLCVGFTMAAAVVSHFCLLPSSVLFFVIILRLDGPSNGFGYLYRAVSLLLAISDDLLDKKINVLLSR